MTRPARRAWLGAALVAAGLVAASCRRQERSHAAVAPSTAPARPTLAPSRPPEPVAPSPTAEATRQAIAWLSERLRAPTGDPSSPWILAHGMLAFGKDLPTSDGRSAVDVVAAFAERHTVAGRPRYTFPVERDGRPVEPHPHLLVKTFLEVGVERSRELRAGDGTAITLGRLLDDTYAVIGEPRTDAEWYSAAWWLAVIELDLGGRAGKEPPPGLDLARLRLAALSRLEADDAPIAAQPTPDAFAANMPMGAAKRSKTRIYGHPCGGLHFVQAVLRSAAASAESDFVQRAGQQLRLLLSRYQAERALYADTLRSHPAATLVVSGQQLKFFGHLLETLALADELGLLSRDRELAGAVSRTRRGMVADLLVVIERLDRVRAYERLAELAVSQHQLYLDLIGDGCHAVHGLRASLPLLTPH